MAEHEWIERFNLTCCAVCGNGKRDHGTNAEECAHILRGWARAYREGPAEHRFPSDPNCEFFPQDLERAAAELDRLRATEARLRAALLATRALVSEAAMTGFNCHDGDWAERLFVNQAKISAALAYEQKTE